MLSLHVGIPVQLSDNISPQQLQPIEHRTGVTVSFGHEVLNVRQMHVSGDNALAGLSAILQLCAEVAMSQTEEHMLHLYVNPEHVGSIMGKGGRQISDIRTINRNVRFNMEKHPRARAVEEGINLVEDSDKERTMTISGTISDASNGLLDVARVIQDVHMGCHVQNPNQYQGDRPQKRMRTENGFSGNVPRQQQTHYQPPPQYQPRNDPYQARHVPQQEMQHFRRQRPNESRDFGNFAPDGPPVMEGEFTLTIPSDSAGILIGRGGSTITQIRASTGCKIEIDKHPQTSASVRTIQAWGGLMELEHCLRAIRERLEAGADSN